MKSNKNALEESFELLIKEAAEELCNEYEPFEDEGEVEFSEEHTKKMEKLFKKEIRDRRLRKFAAFSKNLAKVACVVIAFVVIMGIATGSAQSWLQKIINFFFEPDKPNSEYGVVDSGMTIEFDGKIKLGYIPDEFKMTETDTTQFWKILTFSDDSGVYFQINISKASVNGRVDTEDASAKEININGVAGVYTENQNVKSLTWSDEKYMYNVSGNIPESEVVKIAKNIKK